MTLTLDEAIESAKLSAGHDRVLQQQHYEDLLQKLQDEERYPFTMALAELNIGPRTGHKEAAAAVAAFLDSDSVAWVMSKETGLSDAELEGKLVHAAMHRDAQWWQNVKDKFKDWWQKGPEDEFEEEFGEPFPVRDPGMDEMYDPTQEEVVDSPIPEELYVSPVETFTPEAPIPELPQVPEAPIPVPLDYEPEVSDQGFGGAGAIPEMVAVESSNLEAVGWNAEDRLLYIVFKAKRNTPRTLYRYSDADEGDFQALTSSSISAGQYFHQNIRDRKPYSGPEDPTAYGL